MKPDFDPEAIARRVVERQQQAKSLPAQRPSMAGGGRVVAPGVTVAGNAATGTGDAQGRPLPTEPHDTTDLFERIEAGHVRRAIRSPIALKDGPAPPTPAAVAERRADERRYAAPSPSLQAELEQLERTRPRRRRRGRVLRPDGRSGHCQSTPHSRGDASRDGTCRC